MSAQPFNRFQYSLAALMGLVAVAAVMCSIAGLIGVARILALFPLLWVFWITYRQMAHAIKTDNRNSTPGSPDFPSNTPMV
jgi:hypothetical protein